MTSSNVSKLLVQVNQIDVTVSADKAAANISAGAFEKTLKNVAEKVPKFDGKTDAVSSQAAKPKPVDDSQKLDTDRIKADIRKEIKQDSQSDTKTVAEKNDQIVEETESVLEEVVEVIKEKLDVTDEDIQLAMENLGLTFIDLLNPQSLAQVVTELTGETDSITLIMNEDFSGILEQVTDLSKQLFEKTDSSFVEIKELFENLSTETVDVEAVETDVNLTSESIANTTDFEPVLEQIIQPEVEREVQPEARPEVKVENKQELKTDAKVETAENIQEDETTVEVVNNGKPQTKEDNSDSQEKTDGNVAPKVTVETKAEKEPVIRHDAAIAQPVDNQIQFTPETEVVTLPTGETVKAEDIVNQFVEQAKVLTDTESTTMELTLNPEGLGKIFVEVTQKGNEITAKLFTENDAVKQALESQMANLKVDLSQNSTKVTSIEVSVATHEFERNLDENPRNDSRRDEQSREQSSKRSTRINMNSLDELSGMMSEEDLLIAQMMQDNGGTLDFMA